MPAAATRRSPRRSRLRSCTPWRSLQGVAGVTPVLAPMTAAATCPSGAIVSEGDTQLKAHTAREEDGVDGSGVTVGILSDSFNQATEAADGSGDPIATKAADDVKSADLPGVGNECGNTTPVAVLKNEKNAAEASDEGRAMAQIVHDLAPAAHIDFASAFNGELAFAKSIKELADGRRRGHRRRRLLLRRAFLPGRPGGGRGQRSRRRRRDLLLCGGQRQPARPKRRTRHRLLGNPRLSRLRHLPAGG